MIQKECVIMKKFIGAVLVFVLIFSLAGCGADTVITKIESAGLTGISSESAGASRAAQPEETEPAETAAIVTEPAAADLAFFGCWAGQISTANPALNPDALRAELKTGIDGFAARYSDIYVTYVPSPAGGLFIRQYVMTPSL